MMDLNALVGMVDVTSTGSNLPDNKLTERQVFARIRELGKKEGLGDNSRPGMFLTVVEGAAAGVIDGDHVKVIFDEYTRASAQARGVGWKRQDSERQQHAKLGVAVKLGGLKIKAMSLMEKVIDFQKEERIANDGKMDYSPFDGMVRVARFQINHSPDVILSDHAIRGLLIKDAKVLPDEADILERHKKAMQATVDATAEGKSVSEESREALREAINVVNQRIRELGGSTNDRKREEVAARAIAQVTATGQEAAPQVVTAA